MNTRFTKNAKIFDICITAVAGMVSVCVMLYGVAHFGLQEAWPELVLNLFYIACLVMIWMYFFNRLDTQRFNYWCSVAVTCGPSASSTCSLPHSITLISILNLPVNTLITC